MVLTECHNMHVCTFCGLEAYFDKSMIWWVGIIFKARNMKCIIVIIDGTFSNSMKTNDHGINKL